MKIYVYEEAGELVVSPDLEYVKSLAEFARSVHPNERPQWQEEGGEVVLYVRVLFSPIARIAVREIEPLYFIQTAVDGEGPHAQEVEFDDFIDACRWNPNAPVERENHRTYLRLDVEAPK